MTSATAGRGDCRGVASCRSRLGSKLDAVIEVAHELLCCALSPSWLFCLQEVYGKLEDPDGLQGLVRLRQGAPCPEDQRLAAEKAGNWSEALTLYEQALQHSRGNGGGAHSTSGGDQATGTRAAAGLLDGAGGSGGSSVGGREAGLRPMQRGYLDCLLHMGHLQGLLTQASLVCCAALRRAAGLLCTWAVAWPAGCRLLCPPLPAPLPSPQPHIYVRPALYRWRAWQARRAQPPLDSWPRWALLPLGAWACGSASGATRRLPARLTLSWMPMHAGRWA